MSPEKLRRRALALGAELEVGGKTINAGRQQLRVVGAGTTKPSQPDEPDTRQDALTMMANAMTLQTRIAAAQSEATMRVLGELADRVLSHSPTARGQALAAMTEPATTRQPAAAEATPAAPAAIVMPVWFEVIRNDSGLAIGLEPTFGEVTSQALVSLDKQFDADGLLHGIKPTYLN